MSKELTYPLTERDANILTEAVHRACCRMIAAQDLMDLPIALDTFGNTLEGLLGRDTEEAQKDRAHRWLVTNYELLSAIFTAVRELVDDTRDGLEMLPTELITEHFKEARKERVS